MQCCHDQDGLVWLYTSCCSNPNIRLVPVEPGILNGHDRLGGEDKGVSNVIAHQTVLFNNIHADDCVPRHFLQYHDGFRNLTSRQEEVNHVNTVNV